MGIELSEFKFSMISTPSIINLENLSIRNFEVIQWNSDIFNFNERMLIKFKDEGGVVIDNAVFIEGLQLDVSLGTEEDIDNPKSGLIENKYCWGSNQLLNIKLSDFLNGVNVFILKPYHDKIDLPKSRVFKDKRISEVVRDVVINDLEIDPNKVILSDTEGMDDWYQCNEYNSTFLRRLTELAKSTNYGDSPYVTFFNSHGEFYFVTIDYLMKEQKPVAEFTLRFDTNMVFSSDVIKGMEVYFGGMDVTKPDYEKKIYTITSAGDSEIRDVQIQEHISKQTGQKTLVFKDDQKLTEHLYVGIYDSPIDNTTIDAKINSLYLDSNLNYRALCVINYDSRVDTGKLITLTINSPNEEKVISSEFSGNWVVIKNEGFIDSDGNPFQKLLLAKPSIKIDPNHQFKNDFIE